MSHILEENLQLSVAGLFNVRRSRVNSMSKYSQDTRRKLKIFNTFKRRPEGYVRLVHALCPPEGSSFLHMSEKT